ncbi:MAG: hypothetical protein AAF624_14140 [Bacteroidota bacterium]
MALLLGLVGVLVWLYGAIDYATISGTDLQWYRPMAQAAPGLDLTMRTPFVYRPLGPWLAGLWPGPDPVGFYVGTTLTALVLAALLYALLRGDGIRPRFALLAALGFFTSPYVFGVLVYNFFHLADLLAFVWIVAGLLLLYRHEWLGLAVVLALGALTREVCLLLIPAAFVYLWEQNRLRAEGRTLALVVLPALGLAFGYRWLADPGPGGLSIVASLLEEGPKAARLDTWVRLFVVAWAPLSLWPLVFPRQTVAYAHAYPHRAVFALLVLASVFVGYDQERLVAPAFVFVVPLMAWLVQHALASRRAWPWLCALVGTMALNVPSHLAARFSLPSRTWTIVLTLTAVGLATLIALVLRFSAPQTSQNSASHANAPDGAGQRIEGDPA